MATRSYNIRQVTNYDVQKNPSNKYNINVPKVRESEDGQYEIFFEEEQITYVTAVDSVQISKLGYCCEPAGIIYPIYLRINNVYKPFYTGKNGIYEMQPENWQDINDPEVEEKLTNVIITSVRVPKEIQFTLDYAILSN